MFDNSDNIEIYRNHLKQAIETAKPLVDEAMLSYDFLMQATSDSQQWTNFGRHARVPSRRHGEAGATKAVPNLEQDAQTGKSHVSVTHNDSPFLSGSAHSTFLPLSL